MKRYTHKWMLGGIWFPLLLVTGIVDTYPSNTALDELAIIFGSLLSPLTVIAVIRTYMLPILDDVYAIEIGTHVGAKYPYHWRVSRLNERWVEVGRHAGHETYWGAWLSAAAQRKRDGIDRQGVQLLGPTTRAARKQARVRLAQIEAEHQRRETIRQTKQLETELLDGG